jgi:hypothetical protein
MLKSIRHFPLLKKPDYSYAILIFLTIKKHGSELYSQLVMTFSKLHRSENFVGHITRYYRKNYQNIDPSYYFISNDIYHLDLTSSTDIAFLNIFSDNGIKFFLIK